MDRLKDKIALITGAARGIGRATAERFCEEGAFVIASDVRDEEGASVVAKLGGRATYHHLDVSREDDWKALFANIEKAHGRLDVLVNNAGIAGFAETPGPFDPEHLDLESWHRVHAVNSDGVALGCKYAIRLMKQKRKGSIVNISSRSGVVGVPEMAAYAASKASVRNHTKTVALYCCAEKYGIRCNSLHPGAILTGMWDHQLGQGEMRELAVRKFSSQVPLGRMGNPLEVAHAVVFLASDEASFITGAELHVDGGILAGATAAPPAAHKKPTG